jgi:hypothetical protein
MAKINRLRKVVLNEISFVGKGDNPEAHVMLLKIKSEDELNKQKGDETMTPEEIAALKKAKEDAEVQVATLTKSVADLTTENETLKACSAEDKKKMDAMAAEAKVKKDAEGEDPIFKGMPEAAVALIKEQRADIEKMKDNELTREYVSKAAEVALVGKADVIGDILKGIAKHSTDLAGKVFDLFKTADARIKEGDLLKESGDSKNDGVATAYDKIVAKAVELKKTCPELSQAQAFTKVYNTDADLRKQYEDERK